MVDSRSDGEVLAALPPPPAALAAALATHQANFAATVTASSIATALATIGPVASTLAGSHGLGPLPLSRLNKSSVCVFGLELLLDPLPPSGLSPAGPPLNLPRSASSRDALFAGCSLSASSACSSRSPSLTSTPASTRPPTSAPATNPIGAAGPASTAPATPPPTTLAVPPVSTIARSFDPSGAIFSMLASERCLMHAMGGDCTRRRRTLLRRRVKKNVDPMKS